MFQSLRSGSRIFLLDRRNGQIPILKEGQVETVSQPQYRNLNPGFGMVNTNPMEMVVNIKVNFEDGPMDYNQVPATATVADFKNGVILIDNPQDTSTEIENLMQISKQVLASRPYHEGVLQWGPQQLSRLNPTFAKEEERDRRIEDLGNQVNLLTQSISKLVTMWSGGDGNMGPKNQ